VEVTRRTLFESETLQIGLFEAHPVSDACGDIERQSSNVVVLPVRGVFSKRCAWPARDRYAEPCRIRRRGRPVSDRLSRMYR
jgi:hypothetical protein